jgi:hypothetical protein
MSLAVEWCLQLLLGGLRLNEIIIVSVVPPEEDTTKPYMLCSFGTYYQRFYVLVPPLHYHSCVLGAIIK